MIPSLGTETDEKGWWLLPPGKHEASWEEFSKRYGYTEQRRMLIKGLSKAIQHLKSFGCKTIYVDGSFITNKYVPNDIDVCWDAVGVDLNGLRAAHRVFWDPSPKHTWQKSVYGCEFFAAQGMESRTGKTFLDFFQSSRDDKPKGIIKIPIENL